MFRYIFALGLVTLSLVAPARATVYFNDDHMSFGYSSYKGDATHTQVNAYLSTDLGTFDNVSASYNPMWIWDEKTQTGHYSPNQGNINFNFSGPLNPPTAATPGYGDSLTVNRGTLHMDEGTWSGVYDANDGGGGKGIVASSGLDDNNVFTLSSLTIPHFISNGNAYFSGNFTITGQVRGEYSEPTWDFDGDLVHRLSGYVNVPITWASGVTVTPGMIGTSAVPEPASLGLLSLSAVSLLRRRR